MSILRRTPFKPKTPAKRQARQWTADRLPSARAAVLVPLVDAAIVAVPKGVRAKPGKGAPTAPERAWMDAIVQFGCVACVLDKGPPRPAAIHHLLRGGQRIGHLFTIPLCDPGHHQAGEALGMISRHPWKARFEERYGYEREILARLQAMLGFKPLMEGRFE